MNSIRNGLEALGIYELLDEETKAHFAKATSTKLPVEPLDKALLERIVSEIPDTTEWIPGLHKTIAEKLGVSANMVERYIRALISMGRIPQPIKKQKGQDS